MKKVIQRLPDAELEVMQALWSCTTSASRADIENILRESRPIAVTTVLTLLTRLAERGFIDAHRCGKSNYYTPIVSKRDYLASQSRRFFDKLCEGDLNAFAAALCDSGLSKDDMDELRRLLERGEL